MIKNGPNPENAKILIDYILRPETERILAASRSVQIPLHPGVEKPEKVKMPGVDSAVDNPPGEMMALGLEKQSGCIGLYREGRSSDRDSRLAINIHLPDVRTRGFHRQIRDQICDCPDHLPRRRRFLARGGVALRASPGDGPDNSHHPEEIG